jgi:hypothetical protein
MPTLSVEPRIRTPMLGDERLLTLWVELRILMEVSDRSSSISSVGSKINANVHSYSRQVLRREEFGTPETLRLISLAVVRPLTVELKAERQTPTEVRLVLLSFHRSPLSALFQRLLTFILF